MVGSAQLKISIIRAHVHLIGSALSVNVNIICNTSLRAILQKQLDASCKQYIGIVSIQRFVFCISMPTVFSYHVIIVHDVVTSKALLPRRHLISYKFDRDWVCIHACLISYTS